MKAWLQSSDLSHRDLTLDLHEALDLIANHDWKHELAEEERLESEGGDYCPAGVGLMHEDSYILHICPGPDGALVNFNYSKKWFLWNRQKVATLFKVPDRQVKELVEAFYASNWEAVLGAF